MGFGVPAALLLAGGWALFAASQGCLRVAQPSPGETRGEGHTGVASRLKMARALREAGSLEKARDEAAVALKIVPGHAEAKRLLADIDAEIEARQATDAARRAEEQKAAPAVDAGAAGGAVVEYTEPEGGRAGSAGASPSRNRDVPSRTLTLDIGGGVTMELVLIRAGEFMMGSRVRSEDLSAHLKAQTAGKGVGSADWFRSEHPRHRVRITRPFYMGKHEVTQSQYERVTGTNPSRFRGPGPSGSRPVESVTWNEAVEFCRRLSKAAGRKVRLPTEAEWEYACRAGQSTAFHFGRSIGSDRANFHGGFPYGGARKGAYRKKTTPVGSFPANAWGLHDMHGNVWEWCADRYDSACYSKKTCDDPTGPTTGRLRVLRGGSWSNLGVYCRAACRGYCPPTARDRCLGFRVVVSAAGE